VSPAANTAATDRQTRIAAKIWNGTALRYGGDPKEGVCGDEFELGPDLDDPMDGGEMPDAPAETGREQAGVDACRDPDRKGVAPVDDGKVGPLQPKASAPAKGAGKLHPPLAVRIADVEPEEVEWLWHPYIPFGKLTSVEGDPGIGKSWLTMALAAQVSRGAKLPGASRAAEAGSVLLLTAEDGAGDTLRPRLDTLGADVLRVHAITEPLGFTCQGTTRLKAEIVRLGAVLVIIDPIVAYLPDRTDMNSASAVRPVLMRLARVAEETGAAILFVRHLSKGAKDKPIYRGLGSIDFTAACRSVLMVGADTTDASKRVVAHAKSNLAQMGPSQAYTLKGGRFAWAGRSSLSAEDLGAPPPDADQTTAREEAREFLLQTLAEGPRPQVEVQAEAAKLHISIASLRRAKGDLGVKATRISDHWEWSLPPPQGGGAEPGQDVQAPEG
jgi:hypothetical protein